MMNVALCIPTLGPPTWGLFDSMAQFQAQYQAQYQAHNVDVMRPPRPLPVDVARTWLVQQVLQREYDYLWFVDQDCAFLPGTLERLISWGKDITGALCLMRNSVACWPMIYGEKREVDGADKWRIMAQEAHDYLKKYANVETNAPQIIDPVPEDSLYEVSFTGCHCLLIKREVFDNVSYPWFSGIPGQEDRNFCLKAAEAGYKIHVDFSTFVGHITGERSLGVFDFMAHFRYWAELEALNERYGTESSESTEGA